MNGVITQGSWRICIETNQPLRRYFIGLCQDHQV
jgi:hypothetical protein